MKNFIHNFVAFIKDPTNINFTKKQALSMFIAGLIIVISMLIYGIYDLIQNIWLILTGLVPIILLLYTYDYLYDQRIIIKTYIRHPKMLFKVIWAYFYETELYPLKPIHVFYEIQECLNKAYTLSPKLNIFQNIQINKYPIIGTPEYLYEVVVDKEFIITTPAPIYRLKVFRYTTSAIPQNVINDELRLFQAIINQIITHSNTSNISQAMCGKLPTIYLKSIRPSGYDLVYDFIYIYSEKVAEQIESSLKLAPKTSMAATSSHKTNKVPILLETSLFELGISSPVYIDLSTHAHILVCGATGSGKTYAISIIVYALLTHLPDTRIVICDYKKSGFSMYDGLPGFYGYTDVYNGIATVYNEFSSRLQANDTARNNRRQVLLIDEYSAALMGTDKKTADEAKRMVGEILAMGRSLGIHCIIGIQRADALYFQTGARDQLSAILMLGNLSRDQKLMLAPDYKDEMTAENKRGQGYLLLDGEGLIRVQVPIVNDKVAQEQAIRKYLGLHDH